MEGVEMPKKKKSRSKRTNIRIVPTIAGINALAQFGVFESVGNMFGGQGRMLDVSNFDMSPMMRSITDIDNWAKAALPIVASKFARDFVGPAYILRTPRLSVSVF